jgi:hypothetical protein
VRTKTAVVVDPHLPPREVPADDGFDAGTLIGCDATDVNVPRYFAIFADPLGASYRRRHGIPDTFDPDLCLICDDFALRNSSDVNKICSDLYSACWVKPWPIMGTAIIVPCSLEQLWIMYNHIPTHLASEPRISEAYKRIILSKDVSAYDEVLEHLEEYC